MLGWYIILLAFSGRVRGRAQWPQLSERSRLRRVKFIASQQNEVPPAQRKNVRQKGVGNFFACRPQRFDRAGQIHRVPRAYRGNQQMQAISSGASWISWESR